MIQRSQRETIRGRKTKMNIPSKKIPSGLLNDMLRDQIVQTADNTTNVLTDLKSIVFIGR